MSKEHDKRVENVKARVKANIDAGFIGNQNDLGKLLASQEEQKRKATEKKPKK